MEMMKTGLGALDVSFSQAKRIRQAAAGLDRLILRDDERQVSSIVIGNKRNEYINIQIYRK